MSLHLVHVRQHHFEESRERVLGDLHTATTPTQEFAERGRLSGGQVPYNWLFDNCEL
jgi:hypothetical protein